VRAIAFTALILVAFVLFLTGCGSESSSELPDDVPQWSGKWVEKNDNFTVSYDSSIEGPLLETIEQVWLEVQACVGIPDKAGLIIEYTPQSQIYKGRYGYIIYNKKYIRVRNADRYLDDKTLRHEFVHWLLWQVGTPSVDQDNHNSPFFEIC